MTYSLKQEPDILCCVVVGTPVKSSHLERERAVIGRERESKVEEGMIK